MAAIPKRKCQKEEDIQTIELFRPSQSHRCVTTLLNIIIDQWSCFFRGGDSDKWTLSTGEGDKIQKFQIYFNIEHWNVLNNFLKDIEKFYELNQQLSMDDLARSVSFTMKSGQWTMQKSHFQEKVNTHKGLSCESGGKSSQKFGASQRGEFLSVVQQFGI